MVEENMISWYQLFQCLQLSSDGRMEAVERSCCFFPSPDVHDDVSNVHRLYRVDVSSFSQQEKKREGVMFLEEEQEDGDCDQEKRGDGI